MIPTSIDGTDITGATIDGQDVQEITVDGQTVFSAGPTIIDDFETQNLNIWSGSIGDYTIDTSTVKVGTASVRYASGGSTNTRIGTSTGIDATPDTGDTHQVWIRPGNSSNSITTVHYASDSTGGRNNSYRVGLRASANDMRIILFSGGNSSVLDVVSTSIGSNWYLLKMQHESNGDFTHELYDTDGTTLKATLSGNDATHISGGSFDNTNVQLEGARAESDRWDHWIITS